MVSPANLMVQMVDVAPATWALLPDLLIFKGSFTPMAIAVLAIFKVLSADKPEVLDTMSSSFSLPTRCLKLQLSPPSTSYKSFSFDFILLVVGLMLPAHFTAV